MPLTSFPDLMANAARGGYAVGYFESWNFESLQAVADAAEALRSPVILGFSGIYLPHLQRVATEPLAVYAAMGLETCRRLSVPACLLFNESPHLPWVMDAIDLGFSLVMFTDERLSLEERTACVCQVCVKAHTVGCAVEGEVIPLPAVGRGAAEPPADLHLTDLAAARTFVAQSGVDALAVNVGQVHWHGRRHVQLDLDRLARLRQVVDVPLVLHGASSVHRGDLVEAIRLGVRKINVGSVLKQAYYNAMRSACEQTAVDANPYEIIGSGLPGDVLLAGRLAMRKATEDLMTLFGSAGRA
jgi:fructose/tagatose bisphosphate aldolase